MNPVFADLPTTVFERMSRLARENGAVNLGQGFPDDPGPARRAPDGRRGGGGGLEPIPADDGAAELRTAVAEHYGRVQDLAVEPDDVMITSGATEALAGALLALIEPGDDGGAVPADVRRLSAAGAAGRRRARFVTLKPPHWQFSDDDLAEAFSPRTRLVLFNNPLNPSGTVFGRDALERLARSCIAHDAVALWRRGVGAHPVDGRRHLSLMALPGMRRAHGQDRLGRQDLLGFTGWKVGFVVARAAISCKVLSKAHQFLTFTTPPNLQSAVAFGLGKPDAAFHGHAGGTSGAPATGSLASGLSAIAASTCCRSQGTYFLNVDLARLGIDGRCRVLRDAGRAPIWRSGRAGFGLLCARTPVRSVDAVLFFAKHGRNPPGGAPIASRPPCGW